MRRKGRQIEFSAAFWQEMRPEGRVFCQRTSCIELHQQNPRSQNLLGCKKMSQQSSKTAFGRLFDPWDAFPARRPHSQGSRTARPNENRSAMHDDAVCRQWNRDARRTRSRPTSPANPTIAEKTIPFHAEVPCTNLLPPIHRGNQNSRRNTRRGARKSAPKGTIYGTIVPRTAAGGAPCASISKQTESHA